MNLREMHESKKNEQEQSELIQLQEQNKELQDLLSLLKQESEKEKQNSLLLKAENNSLQTLNEKLMKQLEQVNNSKQTLKELSEKQQKNKEKEEELNQTETLLKSIKTKQDTIDKELSQRESAVLEKEEAIKRECDRRRAEEQTAHQKLMQEAERYAEEQKRLAEKHRGDIDEEKKQARENVSKQLKIEYRAFKGILGGYVFFLAVCLFGLSAFSIIRQEEFCRDFLNFFKTVPSVIMAGAGRIAKIIPIEHGSVIWVVAVLMVLITVIVAYLLTISASDVVGIWYFSFIAVLLAVSVFFGAEVKPLIKGFNLFGAWLIAFVGSLSLIEVTAKIKDMRTGVIQDSTKNVILFVGLLLFALILYAMVF